MKRSLSIALLLLLVFSAPSAAQRPRPKAVSALKYPNELPQLKLYEKAKWKELEPMVSTEEDVRRVLGDVLAIYEFDPDWLVLLSFVGRGSHTNGKPWPESLTGRVASITLRPRKRLSLKGVKFPPAFKWGGGHASHSDATWDVYSDGSGLKYYIFSNKTGEHEPGDLYQIEYGASDALIERQIRYGRWMGD